VTETEKPPSQAACGTVCSLCHISLSALPPCVVHIRLSRTAVAPGLRTHIEKPKLGDIPFVTAWSPSGYLIEIVWARDSHEELVIPVDRRDRYFVWTKALCWETAETNHSTWAHRCSLKIPTPHFAVSKESSNCKTPVCQACTGRHCARTVIPARTKHVHLLDQQTRKQKIPMPMIFWWIRISREFLFLT